MQTSTDRTLSKKELLKEMGITDRLLKFWVNWYKLSVNRRGRGSNYPPNTVNTLLAIKRLADSRYFTMRFVRDLLRASAGADPSALISHLEFCRSILAGDGAQHPMPSQSPLSSAKEASPGVSNPSNALGKKMREDLL